MNQAEHDAAWEHAQWFVHDNLYGANGFFGDFKLLAVEEGYFEIAYEMKRQFVKPGRVIFPDENPTPQIIQYVTIEIKGTWRVSWNIWKGEVLEMLRRQIEGDFKNAFEKYCQEQGWQL